MILDTNALSAWAEGLPTIEPALRAADRLVVPVVVLGEYEFGIRQSRFHERYRNWLATNLPFVEIAAIHSELTGIYAGLRLLLKKQGTPIPANDLWIASLVLRLQLPLLSNDRHFDHVPDLVRLAFPGPSV